MNSDNTTPSTAIATVTEPAYEPRQLTQADEWENNAMSVRTTIDMKSVEGRIAYIAALSAPAAQLQHCIKDPLIVKDWLLHIVNRTDDDTGEVKQGLRLALILADGSIVSTGSNSFIDAWAHVYRSFKNEPTWPVLKIKVAGVKARVKGQYLVLESLQVIEQAKPDKPGRK